MLKLLIVLLFILKIKTENENNFKMRSMPKRRLFDSQTDKTHDSVNKERLNSVNPANSLRSLTGRKKNIKHKEAFLENRKSEINTFKKNSKQIRRHICVTGQRRSEQYTEGSTLNYKYSQENKTRPTFFRNSKSFRMKKSTVLPLKSSIIINKRSSVVQGLAQKPEEKLKRKEIRLDRPIVRLKEEPYNPFEHAPEERNDELNHYQENEISKFKPDKGLHNHKEFLHLPWNKIPEKRETTESCFESEQIDGAVTLIIALLDMNSLKKKPNYTQNTLKKKVLTRDPSEGQGKRSTKKMAIFKKMKNIMGQSSDEKRRTEECTTQPKIITDSCTNATVTKDSCCTSNDSCSKNISNQSTYSVSSTETSRPPPKLTTTNSSNTTSSTCSSPHGSSMENSCSELAIKTNSSGDVVLMIAVRQEQDESTVTTGCSSNSSLVTSEAATASKTSHVPNGTVFSTSSVSLTLQNTSPSLSTTEYKVSSTTNSDQTTSSTVTTSPIAVETTTVSPLTNSESSTTPFTLNIVTTFSNQTTPSYSSETTKLNSIMDANQTTSLSTTSQINESINTINSVTTHGGSNDTGLTEVSTLLTVISLSTTPQSEQTDGKPTPLTICFTLCPKSNSLEVSNQGLSTAPTVQSDRHQDVGAFTGVQQVADTIRPTNLEENDQHTPSAESKQVYNSEVKNAEIRIPADEAQGLNFSPPPVAVLSHEPEFIDALFNTAKSGASDGLWVTPSGNQLKTGVEKEQEVQQSKHVEELIDNQLVRKSTESIQSGKSSPTDYVSKCRERGQLFVEPWSTCQTGGSFSPGPFIDGYFNQSKVNAKSLADFSKLFAVLATKKCK